MIGFGDRQAEMEQLLEQQRQFLLGGDLAAIAALQPKFERVMAALENARIADPSRLQRLKQQAERQARMLQSALRGLSDARRALMPRDTGFSGYNAQGQRNSWAGTSSRIEQRS